LAASGLLCRRIGGPPVFSPPPPGVVSPGQVKRQWQTSKGPDPDRPSLYTYLWRAAPHSFFAPLHPPPPVQACTRRLRSDTPLQALALLNDEAFVEIARALAERVVAEVPASAPDRARIECAFRLCLGRPPADREIRDLEDVLEQERGEGPSRS